MRAYALLLVATCLLVGVAADACADQVYRWVDKDGQVHYSSTPPPAATGLQPHKLDIAPQVVTLAVPAPQSSPQQHADADGQETGEKAQAERQTDPAQCADLQLQLTRLARDRSITDAVRARKQRMIEGRMHSVCP